MQEPAPLRSLHTAFAPHGDGLQGIFGPSVGTTKNNKFVSIVLNKTCIDSMK